MSGPSSDDRLRDWEQRIANLDARLDPIAKRLVDVFEDGWMDALKARPSPLDEAGVRAEAQSLLLEIVHRYDCLSSGERAQVRGVFAKRRAFAWAATLPHPVTSADTFREHVIHFSIADQGQDSRDALVWLRQLCRDAGTAGVPMQRILEEVADLSSDVDKFGMGSTKDQLMAMAMS